MGRLLKMALLFEGLHNLEGSIGIIGSIGQLSVAKIGAGPIAGSGGFGFFEALFQEHAHGTSNANLSPISHLTEGLIKIEDVI